MSSTGCAFCTNTLLYIPNVKIPECNDKEYPAIMLNTPEQNDAIQPAHSLKFIATLQFEAKKRPNQKNPFIIKVESGPDQGLDKPTAAMIAETVDMMSFIVLATGIQFQLPTLSVKLRAFAILSISYLPNNFRQDLLLKTPSGNM